MLIIGFRVLETLLTTLFYVCETCGNPGAHQLVKRVRRLSVFFIPLFSVGTRHLDLCSVCGRVLEVSRDQAELASRQTGPDLR